MFDAQKEATALVAATDSDFEWMLGNEPSLHRDLALPPGGVDEVATLEHVRRIMQRNQVRGYSAAWMIVCAGEVVGLCGFKAPPSSEGEVEIGYGIAATRRGRGHATRAVEAMLAAAKSDPSIRAVIADTAIPNHASQRVLEHNGFERTPLRPDPADGHVIRWRKCVAATALDYEAHTRAPHSKPFASFDHVQLAMPPGEEDCARRFYAGTLGMNELPKPEALRTRGGAWFSSGDVQLHLGVEPDFTPAKKAHPALRCTDLAALEARLELAQVAVSTQGSSDDGARHLYVEDPFGNRIEFIG